MNNFLQYCNCNWTQAQNHLVCKQTLNHLAKLFIYEKVVLGSSLVAVTYKPQNWLAGNAKLAVKPNQVSCGI